MMTTLLYFLPSQISYSWVGDKGGGVATQGWVRGSTRMHRVGCTPCFNPLACLTYSINIVCKYICVLSLYLRKFLIASFCGTFCCLTVLFKFSLSASLIWSSVTSDLSASHKSPLLGPLLCLTSQLSAYVLAYFFFLLSIFDIQKLNFRFTSTKCQFTWEKKKERTINDYSLAHFSRTNPYHDSSVLNRFHSAPQEGASSLATPQHEISSL
jgi:hypothetical protein